MKAEEELTIQISCFFAFRCQALLDPLELIHPRCSIKCGKTPTLRKTNHVFLNLPKLSSRIEAFIEKRSAAGEWSSNALKISAGWLRSVLQPRCITRDLRWGVPVPLPGYEKKVLVLRNKRSEEAEGSLLYLFGCCYCCF